MHRAASEASSILSELPLTMPKSFQSRFGTPQGKPHWLCSCFSPATLRWLRPDCSFQPWKLKATCMSMRFEAGSCPHANIDLLYKVLSEAAFGTGIANMKNDEQVSPLETHTSSFCLTAFLACEQNALGLTLVFIVSCTGMPREWSLECSSCQQGRTCARRSLQRRASLGTFTSATIH